MGINNLLLNVSNLDTLAINNRKLPYTKMNKLKIVIIDAKNCCCISRYINKTMTIIINTNPIINMVVEESLLLLGNQYPNSCQRLGEQCLANDIQYG